MSSARAGETLGEYIERWLSSKCVEEVVSMAVKFTTGETVTITSRDNPANGRLASEVASMEPLVSAEAGCL